MLHTRNTVKSVNFVISNTSNLDLLFPFLKRSNRPITQSSVFTISRVRTYINFIYPAVLHHVGMYICGELVMHRHMIQCTLAYVTFAYLTRES